MKRVHCAICGKTEKIEKLYAENLDLKKINKKTFSARRLPDRVHYKLVRCKNCGLVFSQEIVSQELITKLYKQSGFSYNKAAKYLGKTYLGYYRKYIGINPNEKVLDVGAGNGFFMNELHKSGVKDVWGVEPGQASVNKAPVNLRKKIVVDILNNKTFKKNSFDVICCFHTLDHIVDPSDFLKIIYSYLKPGGKVFFVVHDTDGISVRLFGERSPIFDIEHIFLFNKKNLAKIFKVHKFKKTFVFSHYNNYPIYYWFYLLPLPNQIKLTLLKMLNKSRVGDIPIKINPGNIGIIARK